MIFRKRQAPGAGSADVVEEELVPRGMLIAGAWSWRIIAVMAVLATVIFLIIQLSLIVIPLLVAVLLASLLIPLVHFLQRHRWPKWLAVTLAEIGTLIIIAGLVLLVVNQISSGMADLRLHAMESFEELKAALVASPLQVTEAELNDYVAQALKALQDNASLLWSGALSVGTSVGHFLTGLLLALFSTLFILIDGDRIWAWFVRLFPKRARVAVDSAGTAGWSTLGNFVRVQILVAAIDAVGIGVGAAILQLPLAIPIAILVFFGSFIPIVGSILTGAVAVIIALIYYGWGPALIMLAIVLLVQQIEGHVLQPLIMGTAVKIHPLAVVLAVTAGALVAGIPGALFAVPFVAVLNVMIKHIASGSWRRVQVPPGPVLSTGSAGVPSAPASTALKTTSRSGRRRQ